MSVFPESNALMRTSTSVAREEAEIARGNESLLDAFDAIATRFQDRTAVRMRTEEGWTVLTYGALRSEARRVASWLLENGITRGSAVALLSESRPEWPVALLATMMAGATAVPLDAKLTPDEVTVLLSHCAPQVLFVSKAMHPVAAKIRAKVASIKTVVVIDGKNDDVAVTFASMRPRETRQPRRRGASETALIVYTSGTTGNAKGVKTTFGNLLFEMRAVDKAIGSIGAERHLSVLPLNHLYELICGFFTPLSRGASICYSESLLPDDVTALMRSESVTSLVGVPLLFRALKRGIERTIRQRGAFAQRMFDAMLSFARFLPSHAARRFFFRPVLSKIGPSLKIFYSGGAALEVDVARFFDRLGIPTFQGYGLSETSPVIATCTPSANRHGSVGKPLAGVEVRIVKKSESDREGEIHTRGPHVMAGYLNRDDLTDEMIDAEGWLRTGDLGYLDDEGYLYVTGRSKDLIVLGGGKKVHPDEVEDALVKGALFKEVCMLGTPAQSAMARGFDEVTAVVVPDDALAARFERSPDDLRDAVTSEVARLAKAVASFKRPTRVLVRMDALPKTATRKLKRPLVREWVLGQDGTERKQS
jgi:long-chain acyl-CoA synthetase